jgi:hypothetical protein
LRLILVSPPVRQALALDTLESISRPFAIADSKAGGIVMTERGFRDIATAGEPERLGVVASFARPGGNVTGVTL